MKFSNYIGNLFFSLYYNFARDNLYDVIEKGNEALEDLIQVAKASEHPRAYEVVAQLIKTLNDSNQNLMDVQKKLKDLNKNQSEGPKNVTNALFVDMRSTF